MIVQPVTYSARKKFIKKTRYGKNENNDLTSPSAKHNFMQHILETVENKNGQTQATNKNASGINKNITACNEKNSKTQQFLERRTRRQTCSSLYQLGLMMGKGFHFEELKTTKDSLNIEKLYSKDDTKFCKTPPSRHHCTSPKSDRTLPQKRIQKPTPGLPSKQWKLQIISLNSIPCSPDIMTPTNTPRTARKLNEPLELQETSDDDLQNILFPLDILPPTPDPIDAFVRLPPTPPVNSETVIKTNLVPVPQPIYCSTSSKNAILESEQVHPLTHIQSFVERVKSNHYPTFAKLYSSSSFNSTSAIVGSPTVQKRISSLHPSDKRFGQPSNENAMPHNCHTPLLSAENKLLAKESLLPFSKSQQLLLGTRKYTTTFEKTKSVPRNYKLQSKENNVLQ